jgi:hypothetical protein
MVPELSSQQPIKQPGFLRLDRLGQYTQLALDHFKNEAG